MGLPGTKGQLIIVTESQITGQDLVLFIDFKLANCPVGYCPPKVTDRLEVRVVMCVCLCMYVCVCVYVWLYACMCMLYTILTGQDHVHSTTSFHIVYIHSIILHTSDLTSCITCFIVGMF